MAAMQTNDQDLHELMQHADTEPVVMINLLRFKAETDGGEAGVAAYARYMLNAAPFLEQVGGRLLWEGTPDQLIIGSRDDRWDKVLLVQYPSRAAFVQMVGNPEFQAVQRDRLAALESTVLIAATTERGPTIPA